MGRIVIENVSKSYDGVVKAVDDLNMVIEDGEFITLLGPSGCGKSTTLNLLAGFLVPDSGRILVDDVVVSSASDTLPPERRKMGMVFQSYALWPHKTVLQNVAYGLRRNGVRRKQANIDAQEMLELVGLPGFGSRTPGQLSGGQQQRVALARSLVTKPSILLLDEPLSNLDAKLRDRMRYELQVIQSRTKTTFVYVTHDQVEAMAMSSRVAVMQDGQLCQYAPPRDIYQRPATPYVADFMGLINMMTGTMGAIEANGDRWVELDAGASLRLGTASLQGLEEPAETGTRVAVGIRPESLTVVTEQQPGDAIIAGRVHHLTLYGNYSHLFVEVGDAMIRIQTDSTFDLAPGSPVQLRVATAETNVYALQEAAAFISKDALAA